MKDSQALILHVVLYIFLYIYIYLFFYIYAFLTSVLRYSPVLARIKIKITYSLNPPLSTNPRSYQPTAWKSPQLPPGIRVQWFSLMKKSCWLHSSLELQWLTGSVGFPTRVQRRKGPGIWSLEHITAAPINPVTRHFINYARNHFRFVQFGSPRIRFPNPVRISWLASAGRKGCGHEKRLSPRA